MGGPGSGRHPEGEARRVALAEAQDNFRMEFYRLAGMPYPNDEQEPKRSRAQVVIDEAIEAAITMYKKKGSVKGLELILPYLIGIPRQGITIEGNLVHTHTEETLDLSKLSQNELDELERLVLLTAPGTCRSCGSSCGGNCKALPPGEIQ